MRATGHPIEKTDRQTVSERVEANMPRLKEVLTIRSESMVELGFTKGWENWGDFKKGWDNR